MLKLWFWYSLWILNKAVKDLLEEKKNENTIDSYLALSQCLPDPFHVGHVIENGYGINPVQLTTLRNDPHLTALLVEHLKVAVCRNRDRMDVDSMLFFKIIFAMIITFFFLLHTIYNTNITYATRDHQGERVNPPYRPSN